MNKDGLTPGSLVDPEEEKRIRRQQNAKTDTQAAEDKKTRRTNPRKPDNKA